ncbi:MAG: patatin-like phospholipase family protein [Caldilineaceae bacterium]
MATSNTLIADRKVVWDNPPLPQRVGLVLGGGAARGIAHVGVLQALEDNGIYPAVIAGTSVGALVGGLYAAGVSSMRLATIVRDLKWLDLVSLRLPAINWSDPARTIPMGMVDLDKLMEWIDQVVGSPVTIQQLNLPFAAVATDLLSGEIVVMNEGSLAEAIRASCSVPGVFTPYHRNGRLLVDGVVVNNLPVSVAQDLGADYVIAVDLLPLLGDAQAEPRNVVELSMTALFMLARATQIEQELADILIAPEITHINLADLSAGEALMEAGRRAAEAAMPRIQAALTGTTR